MSAPFKLAGQVFGRLTVLHRTAKLPGTTSACWLCQCTCGNQTVVVSRSLVHGDTKSCGCVRKEVTSARSKTHGKSRSKVYIAWLSMKDRCYNPNDTRYEDWGGRGITVCDRWLHSFENFLADMGEPPTPKHSLDRKETNGNYEPDNCRWATNHEQANNSRRCQYFTYEGETKTLSEWATFLGFKYRCLYSRILRDGIPFEIAISYRSGDPYPEHSDVS